MAGAPTRFEDAVVELAKKRSTGGLEATDGRRRWQFYFDGGQLVCTRSNLKSEQDAAVKEGLGELDADAMAAAQAAQRVKNACASEALTWKFHTGAVPPHRRPTSLGTALVEGVAHGRDPQIVRQAIGPLWEGSPRLKGDAGALRLEAEHRKLLVGLDGSRRTEDVVAGSRDRKVAMAVLWLAMQFDLIEDAGTAQQKASPKSDDVSDLDVDFDIGALIAEEVAQGELDSMMDLTPMPVVISRQGRDAPQSKEPTKTAPKTALEQTATKPTPPGNRVVPKGSASGTPQEVRLKELDRLVYGADNYFQMFGLPWNAPPEQFRQKYMDFARELHPDRYNAAPEAMQKTATDLFDRIRGAWEIIENEAERKKYTDRVIHGKQSEEEEAMAKVQAYYKAEGEFKRGLAAFNNGRTVEAHNFFKAAVESSPDEYEFLLYYGYTLSFTSRTKDPQLAAQGIQLIQRVLRSNQKQDRKLDNGWILLGRAWRDQGDFQEALRAFKTAHEVNPNNADAKRQYQRTKEQMDGAEANPGFLSRMFGKDPAGGKTGTKNRR